MNCKFSSLFSDVPNFLGTLFASPSLFPHRSNGCNEFFTQTKGALNIGEPGARVNS